MSLLYWRESQEAKTEKDKEMIINAKLSIDREGNPSLTISYPKGKTQDVELQALKNFISGGKKTGYSVRKEKTNQENTCNTKTVRIVVAG